MESNPTMQAAEAFAAAAEAAAKIIQATITAFEQLAQAIETSLPVLANAMRSYIRQVLRAAARWWQSGAPYPCSRYAMRARKMGRVVRRITR